MKKTKKTMSGLYLFPAALAAVFMSSVFIIISPLSSKNIVTIPTVTPVPKLVTISSPDLTLPFKSPLTITGKIDRSWVFEGSFPVKLYDDQNKILFQTTGLAPHWTEGSGQFVDFTADLRFSTTAKTGFLVISNDNPSGLPQNSKSIKFPVIFSNSSTIDTSSWKNYSKTYKPSAIKQ